MAEGLNRVLLFGNLGQDPDLKITGSGTAILKLRLATTESYVDRDKQRQERTEWHSVVLFGRRAEALSKFLTKGSRLFVEGGLHTSSYDDRDGVKRYRTEVVASNIILVGGKGEGQRREQPKRDPEQTGFEDGYGSPDGDMADDDIPF
jgi:single-strand DNA-binding protein